MPGGVGIGLDHGIIGLEQPSREGVIDLRQAVLAIVGQQADGLGAGQFLGHGQVARGQLDGRELEPDLGKPAAGRVLRGGGSECCSCRIVVARQSLGDALKITEVGPFIRVLGVFPQFDKSSASRLVVAVLKCGNDVSGNDRRRGADRGPSSNRRWQHSGWIGGGGNPACGFGRLEQARGRVCNNHKRKSSPQESPGSSRHHANDHPAISWCHEEILPKQGV